MAMGGVSYGFSAAGIWGGLIEIFPFAQEDSVPSEGAS